MAAPMVAPLPPNFSLESGMVIRLTALDELTGAVVAGVVISQVSIDVDLPEGGGEVVLDPVAYIPAFAYGLEF